MLWGPTPRRVRFVARRNLFLATVEIAPGEAPLDCFLPNPGRLPELLVPGATCLVTAAAPPTTKAAKSAPPRRTTHDLVAVRHGAEWVSVDTRLPNALFREAHDAGRFTATPALAGTRLVRAEVKHGASRFDWLLEDAVGRPLLVEVKSVNLCVEGVALFPDAPTVRGVKHLRELATAARAGAAVAAFFCIQRPDVRALRPNDATDPAFGAALRAAARAGVSLLAFRCTTDEAGIAVADPVPIDLA
jgi:sugar fermentation stimulation protein A